MPTMRATIRLEILNDSGNGRQAFERTVDLDAQGNEQLWRAEAREVISKASEDILALLPDPPASGPYADGSSPTILRSPATRRSH